MNDDAYRSGSYITNNETLDKLCECASRISLETEGRQTDWRGGRASLIFGKLCATCISFLRLNPKSSYYRRGVSPDLWDVSSAATLCRNLIEAFYVLAYIVEPATDDADREFQKALWQYHAAFERHEMLRVGVPDSLGLSMVQAKWESARTALEASPKFQRLSERHQKKILAGKEFMLVSKVDLSRVCGISEKYYRFHYRHCSGFAHTSPYSISKLASVIAGTEEAERPFRIFANAAAGYTALAIQAFIRLCPDQRDSLSVEISEAIALWQGILSKWDESHAIESE